MSDSVSPSKHHDKAVKVNVKRSVKGKRKKNAVKDDTEAVSGEDLETRSETSHAPASPEVVSKIPEGSPGARAVDVSLSSPSSTPEGQNSEEGRSPSKPLSTSTHNRTPLSSSVRHRRGSSVTKLPSSRGQPSSPADDADETESIAESSCGTRVYRSEPERIEYFKKQPECGQLEPHRAFCTRCDSWINLRKNQTYTVQPWEKHRAKCDLKPSVAKETKVASAEASPSAGETKDAIQVKEEGPTPIMLPLSATRPSGDVEPSLTCEGIPTNKSESTRLAVLQADPRAQEIKPYEVLCRRCQKWIKLSDQSYTLSNWQGHQLRCSGSTPNSRVATTERKIALLNDPQVKTITTRSVCCACCKGTVMSEGDLDYDHTKWNEHKRTCIPLVFLSLPIGRKLNGSCSMTPAAPTMASKSLSSRLSHVFPPTPGNLTTPTPISRTSSRSLTSLRSALPDDALAVNSPTGQTGEKRAREETEVAEDSRPSNRPRSEDYKPPEREPPGPWGWFMQPVKAFIRGFREGLGTPT
ncbi:hypothetical protein EV401DRAFT_2255275 [Pisolithus croceorrhizus]|nr:hypothetical protein EV401DRAFT_2255275 [Pisolithus croceorrhizus]